MGSIETGENVFYLFQQIGPYPALIAALKEPFQAPVFEASDHQGTP